MPKPAIARGLAVPLREGAELRQRGPDSPVLVIRQLCGGEALFGDRIGPLWVAVKSKTIRELCHEPAAEGARPARQQIERFLQVCRGPGDPHLGTKTGAALEHGRREHFIPVANGGRERVAGEGEAEFAVPALFGSLDRVVKHYSPTDSNYGPWVVNHGPKL